jgi:hypothetical protein
MNSYTTIGTCSLCGGRVSVPSIWMGIIPPTPTCESCGATMREHGPVVEMTPARRTVTTSNTIDVGELGDLIRSGKS